MPEATSLGRTLVVAGVVHACLFLLAGRRPAVVTSQSAGELPLTLISIDRLPDVEPVPSPSAADFSEPEPARTPLAARPSGVPEDAISRSTTALSPASSAVALPEAAGTPPPGAWTLRLSPGATGSGGAEANPLAVLAMDGQNHFMGRRTTAEEEKRAAVAEANRGAGEAIRGALHDHDVAVGLGSGGPVVSAVEAVVHESTAPNNSTAVLVAVADASGTVTRVDVVHSTDEAAYRVVAEDLLRRLRGQKLRVPAGARGVAMRIDVGSHMSMPSGGGLGLDAKSLGAHFDISDVGSRPRRLVHARVIAEEIL